MKHSLRKGQVIFGVQVGILMLDSQTPFIPGDVGNARSYAYPVRYEIVPEMTVSRMLSEKLMEDEKALDIVLQAAQKLQTQGVRAITSDCGFMMVFQEYLNAHLETPVFLSSLLQLPFIMQIIKPEEKIAVLSASGATLGPVIAKYFGQACLDRLVIKGMEEEPHFYDAIVEENGVLDDELMTKEIIHGVEECIDAVGQVGAVLLECSVMPPYGKAVSDRFNLPVFDFNTMIDYMHLSLEKKAFK